MAQPSTVMTSRPPYKWSGNCMFCLLPKKLTVEHIIPEALNGTLIITASCLDCNNGCNKKFENAALQHNFLVPRVLLEFKRKNKNKKAPKKLPPVSLSRAGKFDVELDIDRYPRVLQFFIVAPPGFLTGVLATDDGFHPVGFEYIDFEGMDGRPRKSPNEVGMELDFVHTEVAMTIAKIGYCFAVAERGLAAFEGDDIRALLLDQRRDVYNFAGGVAPGFTPRTEEIHTLEIREQNGYMVVRVYLFGSYGARPWDVVVGRVAGQLPRTPS